MSIEVPSDSLGVASEHRTSEDVWRGSLIFGAQVLFALVVFYFPVLINRAHYYMADHCYYFQPFAHYIGDRLRHGEWPLWNPYLYCGMSQIAIPSPGVFYPPNWLFALMNYSQGVASIMILHQLVAAVGCFLLIASLGWGTLPAMICGLTFALCGYMFTLMTNFTLPADAAWLPLAIWSFREIVAKSSTAESDRSTPDNIRKARTRNLHAIHGIVAIASFSLFMLVAAGRPEISIPATVLVGLVVCFDLRRATASGALKWQLAAFGIAALLGTIVVLPTVEWVKLSARANGLNLSQVMMWSTNWYDFICLLFIEPFGDLQKLGSEFLPIVATRPVFLQYVPSCYVGTVVITLAVWGLLDRSWRRRWLIGAVLLFAIIMCVGEYCVIAPWLVTHVKALAVFRYPIKWMIFAIFFIAILAARGVHALADRRVTASMALWTGAGWVAFTLWAVTIYGLSLAHRPMSVPLAGVSFHLLPNLFLPANAELLLAAPIAIGSLVGVAVCVGAWFVQKNSIKAETAAKLAVLGASLSLFLAAFTTQQMTVNYDFFAVKPELLTEWEKVCATKPGSHRLFNLCIDPVKVPHDYPDKDDRYTPEYYQYARRVLFPNTNVSENVPETSGYEAAETGWFRLLYHNVVHRSKISLLIRRDGKAKDVTGDLPLYRFCQATSSQFVAIQLRSAQGAVPQLDPNYFRREFANDKLNAQLLSVKDPIPRAYFTPFWTWNDNHDPFFKRVSDAQSKPFDPASETFIYRNSICGKLNDDRYDPYAPKFPKPPAVPPLAAPRMVPSSIPAFAALAPALRTPVTIMFDKPEHVSLSVKAPRPGFVILTDHFYPGWQALIDGVPQLTYEANAESRAVYIPSGSHLIEFNYEPDCLRISLLLSGLGGFFWLALVFSSTWPFIWRAMKRSAGHDLEQPSRIFIL